MAKAGGEIPRQSDLPDESGLAMFPWQVLCDLGSTSSMWRLSMTNNDVAAFLFIDFVA